MPKTQLPLWARDVQIIALVAAKRGQRAPYAWLSDRYGDCTGAEKGLEESIQKLESEGVVMVERSLSRRHQLRYIELPRGAARKYLWAIVMRKATALQRMRSTRASGWGTSSIRIRAIAETSGIPERTIWRWFGGYSIPQADKAARIAVAVTGRDAVATTVRKGPDAFLKAFGLGLEHSGLTDRETLRASAWVRVEIFEPLARVMGMK